MRLFLLAPFALLAACGQPSPAPAPTATAAAANGYAAKVAALAPAQRAGVMMRAIRDGGQDCQKVVTVVPAGTGGTPQGWLATCDDQRQWVVAIADDGSATVANAKDVARHQ
jgi:hypothetical protein